MAIKAILFDLDDTLIPSSRAYAMALRRVGLNPAGAAYQEARRSVKNGLGASHPSSHNRLLYFKRIFDRRGASSPQKTLSLMERYEQELFKIIHRAWKTSAWPAVLKRLSKKYQLAVVSNENTRTQLIKLRAMDPAGRLFKTVLTSEEVGIEKPNPKIFREAFSRLRRKPSECLMVGDNLQVDVQPMLRLGGHALLVQPETGKKEKGLAPGGAALERWLREHR